MIFAFSSPYLNVTESTKDRKGDSNYENFAYDHKILRAQYGRYDKGEGLRYSSLVKLVRALDMTMSEFFSEGFE